MSEFFDPAAPSLNELKGLKPEELPHGLVPPPPRVVEIVAKREARLLRENNLAISPEDRQRMLSRLTLQYYYEDQDILVRDTPQGPVVLAVGVEEIERFCKTATPEEQQGATHMVG